MKPPCNSVYKLCATLCLIVLGLNTNAQQSAAIIIGLSQYKELDSLQFAHRDAAAFAKFLKTQQVPDDNIKLFLNEDATRFNIVDELYILTQKLQKGDKFFFYFTGHGDLEAKIGYENSLLLLYGCYKKNYFQGNEYLQLSELRNWFGQLTKKGVEVIFIADACHSGGLIGGKEGNTKTQKALQESWAGITKILSSQANEFSLEGKQWGGGRGLFSYHLVNGLTGLADVNKDKKVTLAELNKYLSVNVLREADPNIQTPVVQGNNRQLLAATNDASLKKLREDLMRNVPIITEVNIKAKEVQMIRELDKTLTETYDKFKKALTEKRINTFDDPKDYALLHYRKLVAAKIPNHLLQIIKRNLGEGLMERELVIMKDVREKGKGAILRNKKVLEPAIRNLEEVKKLLDPTHYLFTFITARAMILESQLPPKSYPTFPNAQAVDKNLQEQEQFELKYNLGIKKTLLKGLFLEPNMISTYALLASSYRDNKQVDSAMYYQEKVIELLPNQGYAHYNLALNHNFEIYKNADDKPCPHPKAIEYYEKAIQLDTNLREAYFELGNLYMGLHLGEYGHFDVVFEETYRNYTKAILCFERLVAPAEVEEQRLIQQDLTKIPKEVIAPDPVFRNFIQLITNWKRLYYLHKSNGDTTKAKYYLKKMTDKAQKGESALGYLLIALQMHDVFEWNTNDRTCFYPALDAQLKALNMRSIELEKANNDEKPIIALKYREQLKGIGCTYKALQNYIEAEKYFQQAIAYNLPTVPIFNNLKFMGSQSYNESGKSKFSIPNPHSFFKNRDGSYCYQLDAYSEMFFLKWEQGKVEEAFEWLEKAFQVSLAEHGNDVSGQPFENGTFYTYPNLDQARFKTLKAKYFPPTEKK